MSQRDWDAKWIGCRPPGAVMVDWRREVLPAPYFRKVFNAPEPGRRVFVKLCGLGFYELYVNGRKVGVQVLDPVVTQYDRRVHVVEHDVTEYLVAGENVIGVILGNGWYNCHSAEVWHFDKAAWRDYPKLLLQMEVDGDVVLRSDTTWQVTSGPIVFDGLRNGEKYDARLELGQWSEAGYDESQWIAAQEVAPPGGELVRQTMPPCKVMQTLSPVDSWVCDSGVRVYDLGENISGWARITVRGAAGSEAVLKYGELLDSSREVDREHISSYVMDEQFQRDHYILKGDGEEVWEPRFTFHGFRYVSVAGDVELLKLEGRVVYTAFERVGRFSSSNETLNRLHDYTVRSYVGNFVGIPSDCPHREKNGWTADAHLAAEAGLFNFAAGSSYADWMNSLADCQRPSGQLPGIIPTAGWGYNWGSGPAWDSALFLIPWYVYVYTGDDSSIRRHYDAMKLYLDYCASRATEQLVSFGLGDWCHPDKSRMVDRALTDTGYYYADTLLLSKMAGIVGRAEDQAVYAARAEKIKSAFNHAFYKGDGLYAKGEPTAMACAVYQGLVGAEEKGEVVERLVDAVRASGVRSDFGILGAKYIPRALAENGYVELAYELITQPAFPGWVNWLNQDATTLWENWDGSGSQNHVMFGDIDAWMFQYLGGIVPDENNPGFRHVTIKPHSVAGLDWVRVEHRSPFGKISSGWKRDGARVVFEGEVPAGISATVILPDGSFNSVGGGTYRFSTCG